MFFTFLSLISISSQLNEASGARMDWRIRLNTEETHDLFFICPEAPFKIFFLLSGEGKFISIFKR